MMIPLAFLAGVGYNELILFWLIAFIITFFVARRRLKRRFAADTKQLYLRSIIVSILISPLAAIFLALLVVAVIYVVVVVIQ